MPRGIPGSGPNAGRTRTKATKPTRKSKDADNATPTKGRKAGRPARATAKAR